MRFWREFSFLLAVLVFAVGTAVGCSGSDGPAQDSSSGQFAKLAEKDPNDHTPPVAQADQALPGLPCPEYITGSPVGIGMLHAAHPSAREQALFLANILAQSCRRNIALTMLVDGTFGADRDFMGEVVRIATLNGATLHLYLYLSNGPWQRRSHVPDRGFGTNLSPEEFRRRISTDTAFQDEFRALVKWVEPLISYAQTRGAAVYLIPMLEDNLDRNSARVMEKLVSDTVLPTLPFALGRNPCPNCYAGNDASIAPGTFEDQHIHSAGEPVRIHGGLVTNDGASFSFPGQGSAPLSYDDLFRFARAAAANNSTFVAWKAEFQGLDASGDFRDPDTRSYAMPTAEQAELLLQFLQTKF